MERREFLQVSGFAIATLMVGRIQIKADESDNEAIELSFQEAYADATEGAKKIIKNAKEMRLNIPDAPENGLVVPIEVEVEYPMEAGKYIKRIDVLTTKNRVNKVITAHYTPDNGKAYLYVNAKLGGTQDVVLLARTNDDIVFEARKHIKVALGGCG
ncbi:thiosulfate oxidation carrier protein SoxY [Nitratiruptor sp. SB155-2]|uniref:thiosulfate oxidation carrier protein SoxY n=1 Tax=Nitratiruptor sp. (strain SB155-2) TaxID=387092 RepID=UPI0001586E50|nr:thiosulfate oxidation carrier protein SoxY [Nitratiruptor sp. SB155-2]BAF69152.1 sulfur oxidation protein SoxY [Nitratiruptor sp. SB155-2]